MRFPDARAALDAIRDCARRENAAAAGKVLAVAALSALNECEDLERLGEDAYPRCGAGTELEVSLALGISPTVAGKFVHIGKQLDDRLPLVRAAFVAGELDLSRVRTIVDGTEHVSDITVETIEPEIVDAALQRSPRKLAAEITRLIVAANPEEAAQARRRRESSSRNVQITPATDGMAQLLARLTAVEGREAAARIDEMAATVCGGDPRTATQVRADAFMALLNGATHVICGCGEPLCATRFHEHRTSTVQVHLHVDPETLLGIVDHPANLDGHGPIDAALARTLAADGTWQTIIDTSRRHQAVTKPRAAGFVPEVAPKIVAPEPVTGIGTAIGAIRDAIAADQSLLNGEFANGHGGFDRPPSGALTYRPTKELRKTLYRKYSTCTFPNCSFPARKCQFDHIEPFDHVSPEQGGWTIESNGHPVCPHHHQMKTDGQFRVVRLVGDVIVWISRNGSIGITLPEPLNGFHEPPAPQRMWEPPASTPPEPEFFEPSWWEQHMRPDDRPPTLAELILIEDDHHRQLCRELRKHFADHLAIVDTRDLYAPCPF